MSNIDTDEYKIHIEFLMLRLKKYRDMVEQGYCSCNELKQIHRSLTLAHKYKLNVHQLLDDVLYMLKEEEGNTNLRHIVECVQALKEIEFKR
jgi:hypothetical protein